MIFKGKMKEQRRKERRNWSEAFALFPVQMSCGSWVWFGKFETRTEYGPNNRSRQVNRLIGDERFDYREPKRPPPPNFGSVVRTE